MKAAQLTTWGDWKSRHPDTLALRVVAFAVGGQSESALGYSRAVGGRVLTFTVEDRATVRDRETGSLWSRESGECLEGDLAGEKLEPLRGKMVYWGVWAQLHPATGMLF